MKNIRKIHFARHRRQWRNNHVMYQHINPSQLSDLSAFAVTVSMTLAYQLQPKNHSVLIFLWSKTMTLQTPLKPQ